MIRAPGKTIVIQCIVRRTCFVSIPVGSYEIFARSVVTADVATDGRALVDVVAAVGHAAAVRAEVGKLCNQIL